MEPTNKKGKRCGRDEVPHSGLWGFPTTSSVCSQQESQRHAIGCLVADYSGMQASQNHSVDSTKILILMLKVDIWWI